MIRDGRRPDAAAAADYDIAVVGAGPAGITLAQELAGQGLRIALLESGGEEFDGDTQMLYDGAVTGLDGTDLTASRLRLLGGTSNHWGGHCLPLDPIDFARRPLGGMSGWPFSRADLDPAYARAHAYCDLGAYDYAVANAPGLGPEDLLLPGHDRIETAVIRQSEPTNFGLKYRDALARAEDVDLWLWTNVTGFDLGADGVVRGVETATLSGLKRRFRAEIVVLACGAVENARLLLAHNAAAGQGFGDAGGLLGACYMDHPVGGAAFLWLDTPAAGKAYWSGHHEDAGGVPLHFVWRLRDAVLEAEELGNTQFFLIPFPVEGEADPRLAEANKGWRGLKDVAKWALGRPQKPGWSLSEAYCDAITSADAMALDIAGQVDRSDSARRLLLRYESEQRPDPASRVSLMDGRDALGQPRAALHWSPSIADRDSIVRSATLIGQICGAEGLGRIELEDHFDARYWDAATAWHQLGTTRMAVSPRDGVVDADGRLHGTANLYVAGGSVMPSGGRANPTLTIVALSIRLADHLKTRRRT